MANAAGVTPQMMMMGLQNEMEEADKHQDEENPDEQYDDDMILAEGF
jgi:hypothetical protein